MREQTLLEGAAVRLVYAVACTLLVFGAACVDSFGGSFFKITFDHGVQTPTPEGQSATGGRPPAGTHYTLYALQYGDETEDSQVSYAFSLLDFEVRPQIDTSSPCLIDAGDHDRYPGIHVTQFANKVREQTGITDPLYPPEDAPEGDVIDVLLADERVALLREIQTTVKAVVRCSTALPPGQDPDFLVADTCVEDDAGVDPSLIPPAHCMGAESNARRLARCRAYWEANPTFYEGSDTVLTRPLNGEWLGVVSGFHPRNGSPMSGVEFFVDAALQDFDALLVNWQYKDMDGDGDPDYPPDFPEGERSPIGFHYMAGVPTERTRGVVYVPLANRSFNITGEAAVFPNLDNDTVNF